MALHVTFKHTTSGTTPQTYYFRAVATSYPPDVATICGVTPAPTEEQNRPRTKVEELVAKGILIRLVASTEAANSDDRFQVKLLCGRAKLADALDGLEGEAIRGNIITSVRVPQKATFY